LPSYWSKRFEKVIISSPIDTSEVTKALVENNFQIVKKKPDFIVSYGGDGTVLYNERIFPEVPKLIIKKSTVCRKCDYTVPQINEILAKIKRGSFTIKEEIKLETTFKDKKLVGLNEIQIHSKLPIYAVRFSLNIEGKELPNLVGDGVIFATPFGSTGYYKSTGGKEFKKGIGISLNNLYNKKIKSFVVNDDSIIQIKINRGPGLVFADNNESFILLEDNDLITINKSKSIARFIYITEK
jgi:NAD+ kinase